MSIRLFLVACLGQFLLAQAQESCNPGKPCPSGSRCHPHKGVCVEDLPNVTDRPVVWLDDTDDRCDRSEEDCELFGFQSAGSHPSGRGDTWCKEGEIVRCKVPDAPPTKTSPVNEFRVMTYNVWERPFWITNDGQRERTCRIPAWIATNHPYVDAIGLQEVFMGGCFANQLDIRALFCHYGFCHFTPTVDEEGAPVPGGMFVVSRWPILALDQLVFDNDADGTWDGFSPKGVSYAKLLKKADGSSRTYHVMTTHFQSGNHTVTRESQAGEWAQWFSAKNVPKSEAVVLCGDLNVDRYSEERHLDVILANLGAIDPPISGTLNVTSDKDINDIKDDGDSQWLDYVLYRKDHLQPAISSQTALYPLADKQYEACWCEQCVTLDAEYIYPDDLACQQTRKARHLSDHFPVLGSFIFS